MLACWLAMGVAILTKGLVGMALPGLVLVIYTIITRDLGLWRRLHLVSGIALMLLIAVPWFWLVSERNPEFLHFFFIHEHWQRYTSNVHSRKSAALLRAARARRFPAVAGPGSAHVRAVRERAGVTAGSAPRPFQPALLAAIWAVAIFVFFSLSHSKLPGYILPIFPALASSAASRWIRSPNAPGAASLWPGWQSGQSGCWQALSSPR